MSTDYLSGAKARPMRKADNLTAIYGPLFGNVGSSISNNARGLRGLEQGQFYFFSLSSPIINTITQYNTIILVLHISVNLLPSRLTHLSVYQEKNFYPALSAINSKGVNSSWQQ
jgi:hypothetical protein